MSVITSMTNKATSDTMINTHYIYKITILPPTPPSLPVSTYPAPHYSMYSCEYIYDHMRSQDIATNNNQANEKPSLIKSLS